MNNNIVPAIVLGAVGAALSLILVPVFSKWGPRWGLLDHPGGRKQHAHAVPLVGGLAIMVSGFIALAVGSLWGLHTGGFSWWFIGAIAVILMIGVCDDVFELSHRIKALLQILVILPLIFMTNFKVTAVGSIFGDGAVHLGDLAIPFTLICLLGYLNAANMIDGLDGLAAGVAFIAMFFLAIFAAMLHLFGWFADMLAFAAATLGFLVYNLRTPWRRRAMAFLGDGGSLLLGLLVGWCSVRIAAEPGPLAVSPANVAWVLALPVMDTLVVMGRRMGGGHSPFKPDRLHLHHVLVDLGFSPCQATWTLLALSFVYGLYGFMAHVFGIPDLILFVSFLGVLFVHVSFVFLAHRHKSPQSLHLALRDFFAQ